MKLALLLNGLIEFVEFICLSLFSPMYPFDSPENFIRKAFSDVFKGIRREGKG